MRKGKYKNLGEEVQTEGTHVWMTLSWRRVSEQGMRGEESKQVRPDHRRPSRSWCGMWILFQETRRASGKGMASSDLSLETLTLAAP